MKIEMLELTNNLTNYDEAIGLAARTFAAFKSSIVTGQTMWLPAERDRGALSAEGLARFTPLEKLIVVPALKHKDALWTAEQALRSGAIEFFILELTELYTLTESRRLKLALEAGESKLLVILPQAARHSNSAAYTRWSIEPVKLQNNESKALHQRWELIKNKSGTLSTWTIKHNASDDRKTQNPLSVVPFSSNGDTD